MSRCLQVSYHVNTSSLKDYYTVSSCFPEIFLIQRYLCEQQIAENPIKILTQTVITDI